MNAPSQNSSTQSACYDSKIDSLNLVHQGKVRDIYEVNDNTLLIITTDRLSAFDFILPTPIPEKGRILTDVSNFWFNFFSETVPNHLSDMTLEEALPKKSERDAVQGRAMLVKKVRALPIEAIVRGYIIGSGWNDYKKNNAVCGITLPNGLQLAEQLPEAIYTPSSKADVGDHDENITYTQTESLVGKHLAKQIKDVSLLMYKQASEYALKRGIIIADTKFEFGIDDSENLILIDEALTPDSSRFWEKEHYQVGTSPLSFDKQYVRDYLNELVDSGKWNKLSPAPSLPNEVATNTQKKYQKALDLLTS